MKMSSEDKDKDMLLDQTWERIVALAENIDRTFLIRKRIEVARKLAKEYPVVTACIIVFLAMCSVPLLCFMAFALVSTIVTFCGFLVVEGVLLAIGTVVLCGTLMFITALSLGFMASISTAWFSFVCGKHLWMVWSNHSKAWINQFKYQCWEHASYKEVWQSDRTSDVEELSAQHDSKPATNLLKVNGPKSE